MIERLCLIFTFLCFFCCKGQDRRTTEQRERGEPEPIVWDDPKAKSVLDSIAAPRLLTDTIQLKRSLNKVLKFVNDWSITNDISFFTAGVEVNKEGVSSLSWMSGSRDLEHQLRGQIEEILALLRFEPAYMLQDPRQKTSFDVDLFVHVERDVVRFTLIGKGNVKYIKAFLRRPLQ